MNLNWSRSIRVSRRPIAFCVAVLILFAISAVGSDDPGLTLGCGAVAALIAGLLWRLGEPPALFLAMSVQLSQVVTPVLHANVEGVSLQDVSLHIGDLGAATWFALAAILSLALGLWCGQLGSRPHIGSPLQAEARAWSPKAAFEFCIATLLLAAVFDVLGGLFAGLRQPCLAAGQVRWLGVFVLACVCTARRSGYKYLLIVACLEFVEGFTGYFSDFKTIFLVLLIGVFSVRPELTPRKIAIGLALIGVLVAVGAFWSAIKEEYRGYISEGSSAQVVVIPVVDRLAFLMGKISEIDWGMMSHGFDKFARRLGYVDWLAATMRHVPSHMPYQYGAQIGSTVLHVLEPRLLFPDKPPLPSDVAVLAKYTGIYFGPSSSAGTSVSLGYLGELYVDFGIPGALAATFLFGFLGGCCFRIVAKSARLPVVINSGLIVMLAMSMMWFEESLAKTVGGFVTTLLAILVLRRYLLLPLLGTFGPYRQPTAAGMGHAV